MTQSQAAAGRGRMQRAFWAVFVAAAVVFVVMVTWSLPFVSTSAGGLTPFDMRPMGYTPDEARAFLAALSAEGRTFYLNVQLRLDLLYPALLGVMMILGFQLLYQKPWSTVFGAVALISVAADYLENYLVSVMLHTPAAQVEDNLISLASFWTISKSIAGTVGFVALLFGAGLMARRRWGPVAR